MQVFVNYESLALSKAPNAQYSGIEPSKFIEDVFFGGEVSQKAAIGCQRSGSYRMIGEIASIQIFPWFLEADADHSDSSNATGDANEKVSYFGGTIDSCGTSECNHHAQQ